MESKVREWIELYAKITENISDLIIILDSSFEIIYANQKATTEFYIDNSSITLEQVFNKETTQQLTDEIGPVLFTNQKKSLKNFIINLNTEISFEYNLIINPVTINDEKIILLIFNNQEVNSKDIVLDKISIKAGHYVTETDNKVVENLVEEIQTLIPFTLVGVKKLQTIIDRLNFPIWVKDSQGKFIVINKTYAETLGLEAHLSSGKMQEVFLPTYLIPVFKALDKYIFLTSNTIILEGVGKKVNETSAISKIIQIPLLDNRKRVYTVVGLINEEKAGEKLSENKPFDELTLLLEHFPKAAAVFNFDGKFVQANEKFCNFLREKKNNIVNRNFVDLFPYLFSENIKSFVESDEINDEIFLGEDFNPVNSSSSFAVVDLLKINLDANSENNVVIIIGPKNQEIQNDSELQNIIKNRGKMFDVLIQNNPEPIFIYDKENLKFLEVNEAAIKFYGFSRDEFLQMDLTDLYAPEDIQTLLNSFGDESSENRFSKPFRHRKKDGSIVIVEISKTSFRFNDREAHFNIVKDVTVDLEKEKQNQVLKVIFNATDSLIFNTDASGFITLINHQVIEKLGYTSNELLKSSFPSLVTDEDRGLINTSVFQSQIKDEISLRTKIKQSDGQLLDSEITAFPVLDFNSEIESFTIIVKLISVSDTAPKEIVREVIKEVIVEKVPEQTTQSKIPDTNFISGIFHEILTPMNVIIGFAQELINGIENPTDEQKETADIIKQNRIKMMDTMNAVVEYSDILQNKSSIKVEDVSVTDVVDALDKNIKDITGLDDIQFGYGKISSSLKFKSDKQKFENLIFYIIKVISRLSKDKKVYFSAYPINEDTFFIGLSDQYGSSSEYVSDTFDMVFNQDKDPKDYGLPKLTTYLAKVFLSILGGKYHKSVVGALKQEAGFLFPQVLPYQGEKIYENLSEPERKVSIEEDKTVEDEIEKEIHLAEENILAENDKRDDSETSFETELAEEEVLKPDMPVAEEILSKSEDEHELELESEIQSAGNEEEISEKETDEYPSSMETEQEGSIVEEQEEKVVPALPPLNLADLSCLYIEDQVDSQILFKVQMKGLKDVKFAASFEDSQPMLINNQFDFIVMDINLQGEYNGLDALKIIKTMPALSNIPIIAVTAYVLPGDKEKFITAGFDDFISKPIFREKMMESLEKIFHSK